MKNSKSVRNNPTRNKSDESFMKVGRAIFPTISELDYLVAFTIVATLCILNPSYLPSYFSEAEMNAQLYAPPLVALYLLFVMVRRTKLGEVSKILACASYFGFFAFLALVALFQQSDVSTEVWTIEWINYWLLWLILLISGARFMVIGLVMRTLSRAVTPFVTQNFLDTQYKPIAMLGAVVIAIMSVIVLSQYYTDFVTNATLAFFYASFILKLFSKLSRLSYEK